MRPARGRLRLMAANAFGGVKSLREGDAEWAMTMIYSVARSEYAQWKEVAKRGRSGWKSEGTEELFAMAERELDAELAEDLARVRRYREDLGGAM